MVLTILNILFFIAFTGFAWVNVNDEDAWIWVSIYLFSAVACGAVVFGYYFPTVYLVAVIVFMAYAVVLFFVEDGVKDWITKYNRQSIASSMQAEKPWIEKTREFFGLLIVSGALLINLWFAG